MDQLVEQGKEAVPVVVPLLQDRDEGVRWAAIKVLSEIGGEAAILPLLDQLDQGRNVADVVSALKMLTGQDFGSRGMAWREWLLQAKAGAGTAAGSNHDLVRRAVRDLPATVSEDGQEFVVTLNLPGRRTQSIRVDFSARDADGHFMVQLTTPCGAAKPEHYESVLKLNMSLAYGAVALALVEDTLCFALVATHCRATLQPDALAKSLVSLAQHGDALEKRLGQPDTY